MELNKTVTDYIRAGNTLDGLKLLYSRQAADAHGAAAINRALFGPHRPGSVELIDDTALRHRELVDHVGELQRPTVLYNLGCFALFGDEVLDAHYYFSEAVQAKPDFLAARHNLAYTFELMADVENARNEYSQVLAQDPDFAISRVNLALLELAEGQAENALNTLRELRRNQPTNLGLTLYLCRALLQQRTEAGAQEVLTLLASSAKWQSYQDLKECHAFAKFLCGALDDAEADFRELLTEDSQNLFAVAGLIKICAVRRDWDALHAFAEQYHALNPCAESQRLLAAFVEEAA